MEKQNQVVVAEFTNYQIYKVPKGLNLDDKTIVEKWWVENQQLYITYCDKDKIQIIDCAYEEIEVKYPSHSKIENVEDIGFDIGFLYEDESEEEIDGTCFVCGLEGKFVGKKGDDWMCSKHCEIKNESN